MYYKVIYNIDLCDLEMSFLDELFNFLFFFRKCELHYLCFFFNMLWTACFVHHFLKITFVCVHIDEKSWIFRVWRELMARSVNCVNLEKVRQLLTLNPVCIGKEYSSANLFYNENLSYGQNMYH